jgi:hypothetical protein
MIPDFTSHARYRMYEWLTSGIMVGIGFLLTLPGKPVGTIEVLNKFASINFISTFFVAFGLLRMWALWSNGRWPYYGPLVRGIGALAGGFVWAQLALAQALTMIATGTVSAALPIYIGLTAGEIISTYRAAIDARRPSS